MKKNIKIIGAIAVIIIVTYAIAWVQMYTTSQKYYADALKSYKAGDYVTAIKGKKIENEDESGYTFNGGFEQVEDIWDSVYALPKPQAYKDAENMTNEIINNKLDIKTGTDMFNKYFKMDDKGYLDSVMLRVADLYIQDNDIQDAKDTLETVKEAFPNNAETQKIVQEKLNKIK